MSAKLKEHNSKDHRHFISKRTPTCLTAADLAGSRLSKVTFSFERIISNIDVIINTY